MATLRDRKREQARTATLSAAWQLFVRDGYDHVTVADICAAADIAPRTFHRYFTGKEDLLIEPVRRMTTLVLDGLAAAPADLPEVAALHRTLLDLGAFVVEQREWLAGLRSVVLSSPHLRGTTVSVHPAQEDEIVALLAARGARQGGGTLEGWRLRLVVATSMVAFRVWYETYFREAPADPPGLLTEILDAVAREWPGTEPRPAAEKRPGRVSAAANSTGEELATA